MNKHELKNYKKPNVISVIIGILLLAGAFFLIFLDVKIFSAFLNSINTASLVSAFFGFILFLLIIGIQIFMVIFGLAIIASRRY